ncbi:MAG: cell division protein FtsZ [Candidatus Azambacteria bacterium]|nr:cell division protein FtsZ [Candidatus Azambacteria bacterium]
MRDKLLKRGRAVPEPTVVEARIKVVGVGGSGGNGIDHMINSGVNGVDFIAVNCDVQDLRNNKTKNKIHIGKNLTRGLGAGMNPEIGRQAAEETKDEIQDALKGADLIFITCGLGGGTGTGAAPVVAEIARQQGILTIAVVTKPFSFEGAQRARIAESGLEQLTEVVDTVIVIPNDRLLEICNQKTTLKNAFAACDDVLKNAVQGISELVIKPGIINLDFADVRTIMAEAGPAIMGIGQATGEHRAVKAVKEAISSPLLDISIEGARGILFAVAGGEDLTLHEINEAAKIVTESVDSEAKIIFGAFHDKTLNKGEIKITIIATGFTNPGPNIIAPTHLKIAKKESSIKDKNKYNQEESGAKFDEDVDTPAFLRGPRQ